MTSLARGQLLFAYGTLRRGFPHPLAKRLAQASDYLGKASIQAQMFWATEEYPGAVPSRDESDVVVGDLFSLKEPELLEALDQYEGAAFERRRLPIVSSMGPGAAWVYIYQGALTPDLRITSGDFAQASRQRESLDASASASEVDDA